MCVAHIQKPSFHWTWKPLDICLSWYPLRPRGASQSESRQIHPGLDTLFHLYEWHWTEWRRVCPQEQSCHWIISRDAIQGDPWSLGRRSAPSISRIWDAERSNGRVVRPLSRRVSRRKLSILYILSTPAFVQPSSLITVLTSSRRGSRNSGLARRRYKTLVVVYEHTMSRTALQGETEGHDLPETLNG